MNIAILSGKGGTGKTTVAVHLAQILGAAYIDCDVEAPNGFIFLQPKPLTEESTTIDCPYINPDNCNQCGLCVEACQFHALISEKRQISLLDRLCHGCGACQLVCPNQAISFYKRAIGHLEYGIGRNLSCYRGVLNVGEPMATPVIQALLGKIPDGLNILDCPPGTSCSVVKVLQYASAAVLVAEPSAFGRYDLAAAVKLTQQFSIPRGVVINKHTKGDGKLEDFCQQEELEILGTIPFSRHAAETYSRGQDMRLVPEIAAAFHHLATNLKEHFLWNL